LKDTIDCLESLKKITYPNYEVIVVDNGSKGNDADVLEEKYGDYIKLIRNKENLGFTGGNNVGMKYAMGKKSEFLLILNNDVVVKEDFLEPLIEDMLKDPKIGIVGPLETRKLPFWRKNLREIFSRKEINMLWGCCMLIRRELIEKIGCFYEPYFLCWEEVDYCVLAQRAGFKVISEPRSKIFHKVRSSLKKIPYAEAYYYYRNKLLFTKRNAPFYSKYFFYIYFDLYLFFRIVYGLLSKKKVMVLALKNALIDFWKGNFGKGKPIDKL